VKRFMGRGVDDVQGEAHLLPFRVGGEAGGVVRIGVGDKEFTPPEISAFVLRELKRRAEEHFREQGEFDFEVDRAVITVPAYFNDAQRTATRDAGRLAGLEVLRIINEPTAASLAYGSTRRTAARLPCTTSAAARSTSRFLKVEDGVFQVLATNGDTHLGGDDIDRLLTELVLTEARDGRARTASRNRAGDSQGGHPGQDRSLERRRATLAVDRRPGCPTGSLRVDHAAGVRALIRPLVDRTLVPVRQALDDAGLEPREVDEVVLVGGSTRVPLVRRWSRSCSAGRRTATSTRMKWWRSAPPCRPTS
jgi:molecular chaperone DnaK (HSP70)